MTDLKELEALDAEEQGMAESYAKHEAHNRLLKETCLAAKAKHYQKIMNRGQRNE